MTGTERVRAYYEALNTGDAAAVSSHFTDDAVHYYTRLGPHEGAETIGGFAALGVSTIDAQWYVENAIEQGDLLGFDHKERGHTMLEDWKAPAQNGEEAA